MGNSVTKESDDEGGCDTSEKSSGKNERGGETGVKGKADDAAHMQITAREKGTVRKEEDKEVTEEESGGDLIREEEQERPPFDPDNYDPSEYGPILPNGEINWECPCLGGAAHGPCGTEFRAAFSCFHYRYGIQILC